MTTPLSSLIARAREWDRTATPEQRKAMHDAQRESWVWAPETGRALVFSYPRRNHQA